MVGAPVLEGGSIPPASTKVLVLGLEFWFTLRKETCM